MKVTLRRLVVALAGAAMLSASMLVTAADLKKVSVTAIVDHPALNQARDGVKDELKAAGFEDTKNLDWEYQSAQGSPATASQIARHFVGDKADVIVAIGTPSAQAALAATKTIPIVYSAVTDPVAAQLVKDWASSGNNVTGVSDLLALDKQIALIKQIVPNVKRIGIVYNPGEANSVVVVNSLKAQLAKMNISLVEAAAPRTVDVGTAARNLAGKVDVFYTNTDNNVLAAYEALVKVANDAKIPLIGSNTDTVERGAIAALGVNYYDLGRQTGKTVVRILKGEKPAAIASQTSDKLELFVNTAAAAKQGVTLSPELIKTAKTVIK
jgi:putative ABC transport system substrate-binding protein